LGREERKKEREKQAAEASQVVSSEVEAPASETSQSDISAPDAALDNNVLTYEKVMEWRDKWIESGEIELYFLFPKSEIVVAARYGIQWQG
jgi:hypothetical protein